MKKTSLIINTITGSALGLLAVAQVYAQANINLQIGSQTGTGFGQQIASQQGGIGNTLLGFMNFISTAIAWAGPTLVGLAVVVFFASLIWFIWKGREGKNVDDAKNGMLWSVIAIFIMVSIWGIVGFIGSVLNVGQGGGVPIPQIPSVRIQ